MITLCCTSPTPTFDALYQALLDGLPSDLPELIIPNLPGIRMPIYEGFSQLGMELSQLVQELQSFQISLTMFNIFKPLAGFLGGALEDFLPKIPNTDLTLIDILRIDPDPLYDAIQAALENGLSFPMIPDPLFGDMSIPAVEAVNVVKLVIRTYFVDLIIKITELINLTCIALSIPPMSPVPHIPSREEIEAAILAAYPDFPTVADVLDSGVTWRDIFGGLVFAGLPPVLLPEPLILEFSSISIEFEEAIAIFLASMTSSAIAPIVDFCQDTLGALGFDFPKICIDF